MNCGECRWWGDNGPRAGKCPVNAKPDKWRDDPACPPVVALEKALDEVCSLVGERDGRRAAEAKVERLRVLLQPLADAAIAADGVHGDLEEYWIWSRQSNTGDKALRITLGDAVRAAEELKVKS